MVIERYGVGNFCGETIGARTTLKIVSIGCKAKRLTTEGVNGVKKWFVILFSGLMLGGVATATWAAAPGSAAKVDAALLFGNENAGWINYQMTPNFQLFVQSDEDDSARLGLGYRLGKYFGIKAGMYYKEDPEFEAEKTNPFGEFNWDMPLGKNYTRFIGKYAHDYYGEKWQTYEAAIRVEIFPGQYIYSGIRGDRGNWAAQYDLNDDDDEVADNKEALIFIRGDFGWQGKKFGLKLRPYLYVQGIWLHDYDLTYQINEKTNLLFNMNSLYDKERKYRLGVQFKF